MKARMIPATMNMGETTFSQEIRRILVVMPGAGSAP